MSNKLISLCFLQIVLKLSLANYDDDCDHPLNDISIIGKTSSSITMRVRLSGCSSYELNGTRVSYRTEPPAMVPASMTWDLSNRYYILKPAQVFNDRGIVLNLGTASNSAYKFSKETFTISNLKAPNTNYEFNVESYRTKGPPFNRLVNARTLYGMPPNAPRTGVGLFGVDIVPGHKRNVSILFQEVYYSRTWFNVAVYEHDDDEAKLFYSLPVCMNKSVVHIANITFNRHRFVFHSVDDDNNYSEDYSEITIPAQRDILPELKTTYYEDKENDTVSVVWDTPKNVNVTSYTLAWFDGHEYIRDFVILDKNTNRVKLKKPSRGEKLVLGMSVNTRTESSGLYFLRATIFPEAKNLKEFVDVVRHL